MVRVLSFTFDLITSIWRSAGKKKKESEKERKKKEKKTKWRKERKKRLEERKKDSRKVRKKEGCENSYTFFIRNCILFLRLKVLDRCVIENNRHIVLEI